MILFFLSSLAFACLWLSRLRQVRRLIAANHRLNADSRALMATNFEQQRVIYAQRASLHGEPRLSGSPMWTPPVLLVQSSQLRTFQPSKQND